jgi:hypothetical protein
VQLFLTTVVEAAFSNCSWQSATPQPSWPDQARGRARMICEFAACVVWEAVVW